MLNKLNVSRISREEKGGHTQREGVVMEHASFRSKCRAKKIAATAASSRYCSVDSCRRKNPQKPKNIRNYPIETEALLSAPYISRLRMADSSDCTVVVIELTSFARLSVLETTAS